MVNAIEWVQQLWTDYLALRPTEQVVWGIGVGGALAAIFGVVLRVAKLPPSPKETKRVEPRTLDAAVFSTLYAHVAKTHSPIDYDEVIARVGKSHKFIGNVSRAELFESLTRISGTILSYAQAHAQWLPPITVIVINKYNQLPGSGINRWAERHYALLDPVARESRLLRFRLNRPEEIRALQNDVYLRMPSMGETFSHYLR